MEVKPGYKQTEVGVIPEEWDVHYIGDAMTLVNGRAFKPEDWKQHGTPIIRIQNLNNAEAVFNYCHTPIEEKHRISKGDVVFAWSGTTGTSFGARIWNGHTGVLNQHIFRVIANPQKLTPIYSFLILQRVQEDIEKQAHGFKASFVHVKKSDLVKVSLPIPPVPEQRAIAEALTDVDALLSGLERLITKKRDLKQATMQQLLTGQTRLPGFHGDRCLKNLGKVADIDPENLSSETASEFQFNYISLEDVERGRLQAHSEQVFQAAPSRARRILRDEDVLVSTVRPNRLSHLLFHGDNRPWVCSTGFSVVRCRSGITHSAYVFFQMFGRCVNRQIEALLTGSNYPAINSGDVWNLEIPFPEYEEQAAIAEVLLDMDAEIGALEQRREKTRALKQAMMQELLTGRTRLI
jgi:type I restriction enzyme, S subunit